MNKYGSNERRFTARNVINTVLPLPPADLAIASTDFNRVFFRDNFIVGVPQWSLQGNLFIKRFGVYCNMADGLVFAQPFERFHCDVRISGYRSVNRGSTLNFVANSKAITGTDFLAKLAVGMVVSDANGNPYYIKAIADDNNATITDYARVASADQIVEWVEGVPAFIDIPDISILNTMFEAERFLPVGPLITVGVTRTFMSVNMISSNSVTGGVTFLTKSIDPAFVGDQVTFDVQADLEFTPA